jgi:Cu2+-exporting ATPase
MQMGNSMKDMERAVRRRFWIALMLSIVVLMYSSIFESLFKIKLPSPIPSNYLLLILTTPIVFYSGSIFLIGAYHSLKNKKLDMNVLIVVGVMAAYIFSVVVTLTTNSETFYESSALLVTFVLFGHWMEMRSRRGTSDSLKALFNLVPAKSRVERNGQEVEIETSQIILGDIVILKPGDKVPVDGEVVYGESSLDESMITGESIPILKNIGAEVIGGSVNQNGMLKFKATKIGADTVLSQIIRMVEKAQNSKAPGQRLADNAAAWLVLLAVGSGIVTFLIWYVFSGATLVVAVTFAISAIVIACPDALGLATPTAVAVGTGLGARHNILIKDAVTLENASKITSVLMDKTGTLTEGRPSVINVIAYDHFEPVEILRYAASVEQNSNHPFAKAILKKANLKESELFKVESFESITGSGLRATISGETVLIGTLKFISDQKVNLGQHVQELEQISEGDKSLSLISVRGRLVGAILLADQIKINSKKVIAELIKMNIEPIMITGDSENVAKSVAKELGIKRYFAEVLPGEKLGYVKQLQQEGKFVAMVGDGVNDAPALAQSNIGIAIGAGTDVAIEAANIVLMKSDPYDIVLAIVLSKATVVKMKQNLFWASIYNIVAIPIAAGALYGPFGIMLRPEFSALLMSASSIIVAVNAVSLKNISKKLYA